MKSGDYSDYYSSIFMPKIKNGGFNMSIKITKKFLTNNDCYKTGRTIKPTGIVMHSTGCNQPNAQVFINTWNQSGVTKCVHAFIDANGIYQTLPFNMRCWGCASGKNGSYNNSHIQFEIAEDGLKDKDYFINVKTSASSVNRGENYRGKLYFWYLMVQNGDCNSALKIENFLDPIDIKDYKSANSPEELQKKLNNLSIKTNKSTDDWIELARTQFMLGFISDYKNSLAQAFKLDPIRDDITKLYYLNN
jgi:hypothetical protein